MLPRLPRMRKAGPGRQSVPGAGAAGSDLIRALTAAAEIKSGVASLDSADLDFDLRPELDRELARSVAGRCGADALSVRLDAGMDVVDPTALGADELRRIMRIDQLPDFGPAPAGYVCPAIGSLERAQFLAFFERVFAPRDLGLPSRDALARTAGQLHQGLPVQGRDDYLGRVVKADREPVGLFFLAGDGPLREVGFLGAAPRLRRRFELRGALAAGINWMRGNGISALTAEIAVQNSASLALARRLGARATGIRAVYSFGAGQSP